MPCIIKDLLVTFDSAGAVTAKAGIVLAQPVDLPAFTLVSSVWVQEISRPRHVDSDGNGYWQHTLPWQSESDPTTQTWLITLPDGSKWTGIVPEGIDGPLTLTDLIDDYDWVLASDSISATLYKGPKGDKGDTGDPGSLTDTQLALLSYLTTTPEFITGSGTASILTQVTYLTSDDAINVVALPDGAFAGQIKIFRGEGFSGGEVIRVTPDHYYAGLQYAQLSAAGQVLVLVWDSVNANWHHVQIAGNTYPTPSFV